MTRPRHDSHLCRGALVPATAPVCLCTSTWSYVQDLVLSMWSLVRIAHFLATTTCEFDKAGGDLSTRHQGSRLKLRLGIYSKAQIQAKRAAWRLEHLEPEQRPPLWRCFASMSGRPLIRVVPIHFNHSHKTALIYLHLYSILHQATVKGDRVRCL